MNGVITDVLKMTKLVARTSNVKFTSSMQFSHSFIHEITRSVVVFKHNSTVCLSRPTNAIIFDTFSLYTVFHDKQNNYTASVEASRHD